MEGFQFDCQFCDEVIESDTVDSVKDRGSSHLEARHDTALAPVFTEMYDIDECHDCGTAFAVDGGGVEEFDCPECGSDDFQPLVQRYLYWQIETE